MDQHEQRDHAEETANLAMVTAEEIDAVYEAFVASGEVKAPMTAEDLRPWLGHAWDELTPAQRDELAVWATRLDAYYPDPDEEDKRQGSLSHMVEIILGGQR